VAVAQERVDHGSIGVPRGVVQLGTTDRGLDIRCPLRALGRAHPGWRPDGTHRPRLGTVHVAGPEVAYLFSRQLNILGFLGAGFGLLAAVVSVIPYRLGERWSWYALWLFPVTIGGVAARMLIDQYPAGFYYAGITTVALVALLMPVQSFMRPRD